MTQRERATHDVSPPDRLDSDARAAPGKRLQTDRLARDSGAGAAGQRSSPAPASAQPAGNQDPGSRQSPAAPAADWTDVVFRPDLHDAPTMRAPIQARGLDLAPRNTPDPGPTSAGSALPDPVRATMERSFGADFSGVRVHQGGQPSSFGALAYTQGSDIHFAPGQYDPHSTRGAELLGHELAHVVQQSQGRVSAPGQARGGAVNHDASLEHEADVMGARAARGEPASMGTAGSTTSAAIQCELDLASTWGETLGWGNDAKALQAVFAQLVTAVGTVRPQLTPEIEEQFIGRVVALETYVTGLEQRTQIPWHERAPLTQTIRGKLGEVEVLLGDMERAQHNETFATGMGDRARSDLGDIESRGLVSSRVRHLETEAFGDRLGDRARSDLGTIRDMGVVTESLRRIDSYKKSKAFGDKLGERARSDLGTVESMGIVSSRLKTEAFGDGLGDRARSDLGTTRDMGVVSSRLETEAFGDKLGERARSDLGTLEGQQLVSGGDHSHLERTLQNQRFSDQLGERARSDLPGIEQAKPVSSVDRTGLLALAPDHQLLVTVATKRAAFAEQIARIEPRTNQKYLEGQLGKLDAMLPAQKIASLADPDIDGGVASLEFDLGQADIFQGKLKTISKTVSRLGKKSPVFLDFIQPQAKKWSSLSWQQRQESLTEPTIAGGIAELENILATATDVLTRLGTIKAAVPGIGRDDARQFMEEALATFVESEWPAQVAGVAELEVRLDEIQKHKDRIDAIRTNIEDIEGSSTSQIEGRKLFMNTELEKNEKLTWKQQVALYKSPATQGSVPYMEGKLEDYSANFKAITEQRRLAREEAELEAAEEKAARELAEDQAASIDGNGHAIAKVSVDALTGPGEKEAVQAALAGIDGAGPTAWVNQHSGRKWGELHRNRDGYLPGVRNAGGYKEYYVEKAPGDHTTHGGRRLVTRNGKNFVYYTYTHYGDNGMPAFVRIR